MPDSLRPHGLQPTRLFCPWDFPGKDTGAGCHFLLQGIFLTQGSNLDLQHCRQIVYQLSYRGSFYRPDKREQKHKSTTGCLSMLWDIKASKSMHSPCCHGAYSLAELHQVSKVYPIWGYFSLTPWCCTETSLNKYHANLTSSHSEFESWSEDMCIDKLASQCHLMFSHNYIAFITFYPPSYSLRIVSHMHVLSFDSLQTYGL